MTFNQAEKALAKLADGRYHAIKYERTTYGNGDKKQECTVYIDGYDHSHGETWEVAIAKMSMKITPLTKKAALHAEPKMDIKE